MKNKIEIYGTLGPADHDISTIKEMFHYGMTGIRLNLSHQSLSDCSDWLDNVYAASEQLHIVPDLLVDLEGPELRIGELKKELPLKQGQTMRIGEDSPIPLPAVIRPLLKQKQKLLLDDGKIVLEITDEEQSLARVITGGQLKSRKSIALPGQNTDLPTLTKKDLENLAVLSKYRITGVMLPFVRSAQDLITLKKALITRGSSHVRIFAKIENQTGIDQLPSLLPHCDQVVIARGDLGNAVTLKKLPAVQKKIAQICNRTRTPFMVVTQMLASMETSPVPTRAEVSDIFNAVLDGASSLMLTGETAIGKYPVEAIRVLSDVSFEALRYRMESRFFIS